jgi:hypothetical protein
MLTVLITCENRGRWTLKARPGETASARDSLDQLMSHGQPYGLSSSLRPFSWSAGCAATWAQ